MSLETLSLISTSFIVASGLALIAGWILIKKKKVEAHRRAMLVASTCAAFFLIAYVTRWSLYGSKSFDGEGLIRNFYLVNLLAHIVLATALAPMVLRVLYLALRKRDFAAHKKLARITLPMWLYVAGSGWLIFWMLYYL